MNRNKKYLTLIKHFEYFYSITLQAWLLTLWYYLSTPETNKTLREQCCTYNIILGADICNFYNKTCDTLWALLLRTQIAFNFNCFQEKLQMCKLGFIWIEKGKKKTEELL